MDFKKILSGTVLSFLIGSSFTAQALDRPAPGLDVEEGEVPILSPKQLSKQMKDFKKYLNRVQRCLFTGPCTKEEKAQVWKHGKRLMKYVALAGGLAVLYRYRRPIGGWATTQAQRGVAVVKTQFADLAGAAAQKATADALRQVSRDLPGIQAQVVTAAGAAAQKATADALRQVSGDLPGIQAQVVAAAGAAAQKATADALRQVSTDMPRLRADVVATAGAAAESATKAAVARVAGMKMEKIPGFAGFPSGLKLVPPEEKPAAAAAAAAAGESLSASQFKQVERPEMTAIRDIEQGTGTPQTKAKAIAKAARASIAEVRRKALAEAEQAAAVSAIAGERDAAIARLEGAGRATARAAAEVSAAEEEEEEEKGLGFGF